MRSTLLHRFTLLAFLTTMFACGAGDEDSASSEGAVSADSPIAALKDGKVRIDKSVLSTKAASRTKWLLRNVNTPDNHKEIEKVRPHKSNVTTLRQETAWSGGKSTLTLREIEVPGAAATDKDPVIATFEATEDGDAFIIDLDAGLRSIATEFSVNTWWAPTPSKVIEFKSTKVLGTAAEGKTVFMKREVPIDASGKTIRVDTAFGIYEPFTGFTGRKNYQTGFAEFESGGAYVNLAVKDKDKEVFAHRHDPRKPIVYGVMADFPAERRGDLDVAADYWNRIFASLKVPARVVLEKLPAKTETWLTNKNTIEYRTDMHDGGGLGISQTDPLTGRIVKTSVYSSSAFVTQGRAVVEETWMRRQADATASGPISPPSEALIKRAISDYYVNTWTHEIGHSLGLRHNWAGNLASKMQPAAWEKSFEAYLDGDVGTELYTTSVMDYIPSRYALMVGAQIRKKRAPLPYDIAGIRALYAEEVKGSVGAGLYPYCEVDFKKPFVDCLTFDMGPNSITGSIALFDEAVVGGVFNLARGVKEGKSLVGGTDSPGKILGIQTAEAIAPILGLLHPGSSFLAVRTKLPYELDAAAKAALPAANTAYQRAGFAALTSDLDAFVKSLARNKGIEGSALATFNDLVRARLESYLARFGVSASSADLDAFMKDFVKSLADKLLFGEGAVGGDYVTE